MILRMLLESLTRPVEHFFLLTTHLDNFEGGFLKNSCNWGPYLIRRSKHRDSIALRYMLKEMGPCDTLYSTHIHSAHEMRLWQRLGSCKQTLQLLEQPGRWAGGPEEKISNTCRPDGIMEFVFCKTHTAPVPPNIQCSEKKLFPKGIGNSLLVCLHDTVLTSNHFGFQFKCLVFQPGLDQEVYNIYNL